MESHRKEFHFLSSSILSSVWRGILVGIISGIVVSLFRLLIEKIFEMVISLYHYSHSIPSILLLITLVYLLIIRFISYLIISEPDI